MNIERLHGNGKIILVVEDDQAYRARLKELLSKAGYVPRLAANTREALQTLGSGPVDFVLSDILMPNEEGFPDAEAGFKLVARLRKERPDTPFALLTGWSVEEYITCALRYDIGSVLSKSAGEGEILKCLHMWTTGEGVFGLRNYIPLGEEIVSREFRTSAEARALGEEITGVLARLSFPEISRRRARTMVEEITDNAIMHSRDDYTDLLHAPRALEPHMKSARLEYGGVPSCFGVAITDYMGRLSKKRVLECFANVALEKKGTFQGKKPAITGRGIYITRAFAKEYYINIKHSQMTEVVLIANNETAMQDVNRCSLKINEI